MSEGLSKEQLYQVLFVQLVSMFETAAWQSLGKTQNPLTGKIERDLVQARTSIDMLGMLQAKMKGNLTEEEENMLNQVLANLRLNYVDELDKSKKEPAKKEETKDNTVSEENNKTE